MYEKLCSRTILEIRLDSVLFILFFQVITPFASLEIENMDKIMV